jgi:2,3-bisphosphoglycerate-dependent phosphoglycerate mutase
MVRRTEVVFETHSLSVDNDAGIASGWNHSHLSAAGRALAEELGERRNGDGIAVVLCSDLRRAVETTEVAFAGRSISVLHDWRLRECNYGQGNGTAAAELHLDKAAHLDQPYDGGESWRQAVGRCASVLGDISQYWAGKRVLVIGHVATRWALDHVVDGVPLERLITSNFDWRPGWEYQLG